MTHDFLAVRCPQCRARPSARCLTVRLVGKTVPHQARQDRYWQMRVAVNRRRIEVQRRREAKELADLMVVGRDQAQLRFPGDNVLLGHARTAFGHLGVLRPNYLERSLLRRKAQIRAYFRALLAALPGARMSVDVVRTYDLPGSTIERDSPLDGNLPDLLQRKP